MPRYAKALAAVVGYAFSPIDPIPVLGYLDDLVIVSLGIALAIRLVPDYVMRDCRARARETDDRPVSRAAAAVVVWALVAGLVALLLLRR